LGDRDPAYNLEACAALLPFREKIHIAYMSLPKVSEEIFLKDLDSFLQQSGLGYLDIWFVITPNPDVLNEFTKAANVALETGKILYSGITTHNIARDTSYLISSDSNIDVVMMTYNYLSPQKDYDSLNQFHQAGLGIMPMKPLAGKFYSKTTDKPDPLIRWLASDNRVHTIPIIMNSIEQVEKNVAAIQSPLSEEDEILLKDLYSYNSSCFCRMCGACDGKCPYGLAVSDLVRTSMYKEGYQDEKRARSNLLLIPKRSRQICCDLCEQCVILCPNGVAIKERIGIIKKWFS
jgi:predicted aldo/keto reductase-like oxidoreductase